MEKALIEGGIVVNVIMVDLDNVPDWAVDLPELPDGAGIGWRTELVGDVWHWHGPEPEAPAPVEPEELPPLTARQIRSILVIRGVSLADVQAYIEGLPASVERDLLLIDWEYATQFERDHPAVAQLAEVLDLDRETVDAWWREALEL